MLNSCKKVFTTEESQNQNKLTRLKKVFKDRYKKNDHKWKCEFNESKCKQISQTRYLITEISVLLILLR